MLETDLNLDSKSAPVVTATSPAVTVAANTATAADVQPITPAIDTKVEQRKIPDVDDAKIAAALDSKVSMGSARRGGYMVCLDNQNTTLNVNVDDVYGLSSVVKTNGTDHVISGYTYQGLPFFIVSSFRLLPAMIDSLIVELTVYFNKFELITRESNDEETYIHKQARLNNEFKNVIWPKLCAEYKCSDKFGVVIVWENIASQLFITRIGNGDFLFKNNYHIVNFLVVTKRYYQVSGEPSLVFFTEAIPLEIELAGFQIIGCTKLSDNRDPTADIDNKMRVISGLLNICKFVRDVHKQRMSKHATATAPNTALSDDASFVLITIPSKEMQKTIKANYAALIKAKILTICKKPDTQKFFGKFSTYDKTLYQRMLLKKLINTNPVIEVMQAALGFMVLNMKHANFAPTLSAKQLEIDVIDILWHMGMCAEDSGTSLAGQDSSLLVFYDVLIEHVKQDPSLLSWAKIISEEFLRNCEPPENVSPRAALQ